MKRVIWRQKIHPAMPTTVPGLVDPRVVAVALDGHADVSVWFEHHVTDAGTLVGHDPLAAIDLDVAVVDLVLTPVETGAEVPALALHVGSITHPQLVRHVYAEVRPAE